ncbi:MAG TPA: ion channel [Stellaceae bacterium]|jgi:inward rectifier potassium channel|nr:ion channel [Stellaceae bacterium]
MAARRSRKPRRSDKRQETAFGRVERISSRGDRPIDFYHHLLTISPWGLFLILVIGYTAFNLIFAVLFVLQPGGVANATPGSFADAFFFSVQTMATIGYGDMHPASLYTNFLVTFEVLLGMTGLALSTGLVFARFSRPTARVMFSNVAVVLDHDGVPSLMFRAANQRANEILEAQVSVMLLRDEVTSEGIEMRRFHDMAVSRPRTPMFALTWTVIHPIDPSSPLCGESRESLMRAHAQIIVSVSGIDETFSQTIHARHTYEASEIRWNHRFSDIITRAEDGHRLIDYRRFHDTIEGQKPARSEAATRKVPAR